MAFLGQNLTWKLTAPSARSFPAWTMRVLAIFCFLISSVPETRAESAKNYDIKAVFLFNFAHFVDWPPEAFKEADSPMVIGVLGDDPFGKSLDEVVRNEVVGSRKLVVKRFRRVDEIGSCHILFISKSEMDKLGPILAALKGKPVLTVGETEGFASAGGMIRFLTEQNKIRLRINKDEAKAAGLTISSKLLKVAGEIVETK